MKCTKVSLILKAEFRKDSPYEIKIDISNPSDKQLEGIKESVISDIDRMKWSSK